MKKQLAEVREENPELQKTARNYPRLCRAYGLERVVRTGAAVKSGGIIGMSGNPV